MTSFVQKYKLELVKCYNYNFEGGNDLSHKFSDEELLQFEAEYIYMFMMDKVFGTPDPDESDRPTKGRSALLEFAKKGNFILHAK